MEKIYVIKASAPTDTPHEAVYGDGPIAYRSRERAEQVVRELNEQASAEGWGWEYGFEEMVEDLPTSAGGVDPEDICDKEEK